MDSKSNGYFEYVNTISLNAANALKSKINIPVHVIEYLLPKAFPPSLDA
jgi:hypothetical protein